MRLLPAFLLLRLGTTSGAARSWSSLSPVTGSWAPATSPPAVIPTADGETTPDDSCVRFGAGSFDSPEDLKVMLCAHGIPADAWNTKKTKCMEQLFTELELGESVLALSADTLVREVRVVKVRVMRPGEPEACLLEARQVFADGHARTRGRPLSEKIMPWEGPIEAARRGVLEELGPALGSRAKPESIMVEEESLTPPWDETSAASASYPSLPTRYRLWQCDAVVPGLPGTPFTTLEVCAVSAAAAAAAGYDARARRRRHRRPRVHGPVAMLAPGGVLSARGRPLELPGDLVHEWLWVPAAPLTRASEGATTEWTGVEDGLPQ